jgi:aminopeptidase YwaD
MTRLPESAIGDAYANGVAREVLEDLVAVGPRMAGQDGEEQGAQTLREAFEESGLREVGIAEFEIPGWWRGKSSLSVDASKGSFDCTHRHEVLALPGSPAGAVSGELVDVGYGTQEEFDERDVEGKVAMVSSRSPEGTDRWIHRMEKYASVHEAGAVGFVFRNHVEGCLPPTGEVGYHARPGPIPAVGVSREVGEWLERLRERGEISVDLEVDCRNEPATSQNVEGVLGPGEGEEVLVTAHIDSHDIAEGAMDNGAGCALLAEVGRLLSGIDLDTRVRFVAFGAEEIGLRGAYHHAENADLESVKCVLNVDGAGRSRTLSVGTNGFEGVAGLFEDVRDGLDVPVETRDTVAPHGDQWAFVERGVPSAFVGSASPDEGRGWGHTHADTLDKIDSRDLRDLAVSIAEAVLRATDASRTFERASEAEIRDALDDGYVRELHVGDRWHYDG